MLHIMICDDDSFTLRFTSGLVEAAIRASGVEAKLCCIAASGGELLNYLRNASGSLLCFLDFDFGKTELNGIDLVRRIYQMDAEARIVFVTSHTDKSMDILKSGIRAFGFIEKVPDRKKMMAEYVKYLKMAAPQASSSSSASSAPPAPSLRLPLGIDETVELSIPDITYVDSVKSVAHSICYHTFDGSEIIVRDTIEHAKEVLGEDFIRCHRSVLVNKRHVVSVKNGLIRLSNGDSAACAMSRRREVAAVCFAKKDAACFEKKSTACFEKKSTACFEKGNGDEA